MSAAVGWQCVCERRGRWMVSANELMAMVMPPSARLYRTIKSQDREGRMQPDTAQVASPRGPPVYVQARLLAYLVVVAVAFDRRRTARVAVARGGGGAPRHAAVHSNCLDPDA